MRWWCTALAAGCAGGGLDLPEDPAEPGVPVGVRTFEANGETIDVWYPAAGDEPGSADVELATWVPASFREVAPEIALPSWSQPAARDADVRGLDGTVPVVLFSHGFGGFRDQSTELTAHLASRGYVVVSADHPGRMITDLVPCLLTSTAEDCSFGGFVPGGEDPAQEDLAHVLAWLDESLPADLAAIADLERLGIFGHSAGGGSTTAFATAEPRVDAALPLAGAGELGRDLPSAVIAGTCDGIVGEEGLVAPGASSSEGLYGLLGAGHLAFSDLCSADLGGLADQLAERDDANAVTLYGLRALATDGCPGATPTVEGCDGFLDLATSGRILRHATTVFFDEALRGTGPGLAGDTFPELVVR